MSLGDTTEPTVYIPKSSTKKSTSSDPQLAALDHRLQQVKLIIPPQPYLLAVTTKRQYHLSEYQIKEECKEKETGFKPEERDLQYLSFLRTGWDDTILTVLRPEEPRSIIPKQMASNGTTVKAATKKMSIADYKKRSNLPATGANGTPVAENRTKSASNTIPPSNNSSALKRSSDATDKPRVTSTNTDEPPAKKLKPSPSTEGARVKSPKPRSNIALPPPLSPTLPAFVERLLARSTSAAPKANSSEPVSTDKNDSTPSHSQHRHSLSQDVSGTKRHDGDSRPSSQSTKILANGVHRPNSVTKPNRVPVSEADSIRVEPMSRQASQSKTSVIARIKVPKSMRSTVARILRLSPKRVKDPTGISKPTATNHGEKSIPPKFAEKRPREDDHVDMQHESKRSKSPAQQDRAGNKKPRESTPVMREEVTTPQGAALLGTPIPPTSASKSGRDKQTPSESGSTNSFSNERLEGLQKLHRKYSDLGPILKKEGDKLANPDTPALKRRFIASRIETTLTFMLSYIIRDEVSRIRRRSPSPDASWKTLFGWMSSIHVHVQDHPHLLGLLLQLEAMSLMVFWRQRSELAENGDSITIEQLRNLRAPCEEAQRKFIKGAAKLSVDDLQEDFPKTWKAKTRIPLANTEYKMSKDNLNGDFYLPLTSTSLPIEGIRAGQSLLKEWCRREGLDWTPKLEF